MSRILLSSYRCDPYGVSESYSGLRTAAALAESHDVTLATTSQSRPALERWLATDATAPVRANLHPLYVPLADVDGRLGALGSALKPGFYLYEQRLLSILARQRLAETFDLVWQRTPVTFRSRTRLYSLPAPLVIGPVSGGMKRPAVLADYFRDDHGIQRLRFLDDALLGSRFWMRPFAKAAEVLVTGDYVSDRLPAGLAARRRVMLETGIDEPQAEAPDRGGHVGFTALYVGKLLRYKGPVLAVEAFARFLELAGSPEGARLRLLGEGSERPEVEARASQLGIAEHIEMPGRVSKDEVLAAYADADVFLFPSVTEAFGNVYLEAMSSRLPMVTVANGGGAFVPDDRCAIRVPLAPRGELVAGLGDALYDLYRDPVRRTEMGEAGVQRVRSLFTWSSISRQILEVAEEVVADAADQTGGGGAGEGPDAFLESRQSVKGRSR